MPDRSVPMVHLPEVASTNSWMLEALGRGEALDDQLVVYTLRQTQGRGQVGNTWESEPESNIAFSMLLKPTFVPVAQQFVISQLCCLGILDGLRLLFQQKAATPKSPLSIKWPNDIYLGDEKLAGILIENRLMGSSLAESVLGIGINVRQQHWVGNAPNPTSLLLHGVDATPEEVLHLVTEAIRQRYQQLSSGFQTYSWNLQSEFRASLYRGEGLHPYVDAETGEEFEAAIEAVDTRGPLVLRLASGQIRRYWFKEVRFVLPCGVTKE